MRTGSRISSRKDSDRWAYTALVIVMTAVISTCGGCAQAPAGYSYERFPERFEEQRRRPEVVEFDQCQSNLALKQSVTRSTQLGEIVTLDDEQVRDIWRKAGRSPEPGALDQAKSEIGRQFGPGLQSYQTQTETANIYLNPRRKTIVTLQWVETWEQGQFVVYQSGTALGPVSYTLLQDIRLETTVQPLNCGPMGAVQSAILRLWGRAQSSPSLLYLVLVLQAIIMGCLIADLIVRGARRRSVWKVDTEREERY